MAKIVEEMVVRVDNSDLARLERIASQPDMSASINIEGELVVKANNELAGYALQRWAVGNRGKESAIKFITAPDVVKRDG